MLQSVPVDWQYERIVILHDKLVDLERLQEMAIVKDWTNISCSKVQIRTV